MTTFCLHLCLKLSETLCLRSSVFTGKRSSFLCTFTHDYSGSSKPSLSRATLKHIVHTFTLSLRWSRLITKLTVLILLKTWTRLNLWCDKRIWLSTTLSGSIIPSKLCSSYHVFFLALPVTKFSILIILFFLLNIWFCCTSYHICFPKVVWMMRW